ncbi:MAG: glycosyltransferase, partial [bacterium]
AEILDGFAQDDQRVKVLHLSRNFGHTAAVRAGLDYVNADAVILMDCDGQDDPNTIPRFLERWKMGADVSVGTVAFASYHRVFTGLAIPGWASVTIVSSFFGAINSLGIAILGEYVARNYEQVRGRPSYIVSRLRNAGTTEADSLDKCSESELLHELAAVSEISTPVTRTQPNSTPVASR